MHGFEAEELRQAGQHPRIRRQRSGRSSSTWTPSVARGHLNPDGAGPTNVRPIEGGELCEWSHLAYCVSGRMRFHLRTARTGITPGQVAPSPAAMTRKSSAKRHCVMLDFGETADVARR